MFELYQEDKDLIKAFVKENFVGLSDEEQQMIYASYCESISKTNTISHDLFEHSIDVLAEHGILSWSANIDNFEVEKINQLSASDATNLIRSFRDFETKINSKLMKRLISQNKEYVQKYNELELKQEILNISNSYRQHSAQKALFESLMRDTENDLEDEESKFFLFRNNQHIDTLERRIAKYKKGIKQQQAYMINCRKEIQEIENQLEALENIEKEE